MHFYLHICKFAKTYNHTFGSVCHGSATTTHLPRKETIKKNAQIYINGMLLQKGRDLRMAVECGQMLIDENDQLKDRSS